MKLGRLLVTTVGAMVLLGALVSSASARNLSNSTNSIGATWTRMNFSGGFGTVECEVVLSGTVPNTVTKTVNGSVGSVTAANVPRCARGGATIQRETLPWSSTYRNFAGTLPNISSTSSNLIGMSIKMREPTFGATCIIRSTATNPAIFVTNITGGRITSWVIGGEITCIGAINVGTTLSGTSSSTSPLTVTLI